MTTEEIRAAGLALGFQSVGFASLSEPMHGFAFYRDWLAAGHHAGMDYLVKHAELRSSATQLLSGARTAIVCTQNYAQPLSVPAGRLKVARYSQNRDYHTVLRKRLRRLEALLAGQWPEANFRPCIDSAPLLERELAQRAGLGWFGKNTCLIDSKRGSYFLIALLLTTLELAPSKPAEGGCGTCTACIDACPTGAIVHGNGRWQVDSRQCISYWTIEHHGDIPLTIAEKMGDWAFGCDICQEVCPFNQPRPHQPLRAETTQDPDFLPAGPAPTLDEVAAWDEQSWDAATQGRPLRRARRDGLMRNVAIVQENLKK